MSGVSFKVPYPTHIMEERRREMKRTISAMVGAGSQNHNSRKFTAQNVDSSRSHLNIQYCNEDIRDVYHELFDDAVKKYNEKQTRKDRMISDYYEKIRSGKQEKLFHELILQVGNKDDCGSETENGKLAAEILDRYMKGFQERNRSLRVFSAHLHLDEATPHLHIDFVPYTTGSKRGVETRVSLKQALAVLGFKGGTRGETEWNQWVTAEKKQLEILMNQRGIEWEQKGTHEEHLSVLEYKKEQRSQEVKKLEQLSEILNQDNERLKDVVHVKQETLQQLEDELQETRDEAIVVQEQILETKTEAEKYQKKLEKMEAVITEADMQISDYTGKISDILLEPGILESASAYRKNKVKPLFVKMREQIVGLVVKLEKVKNELQDVKKKYRLLQQKNKKLEAELQNLYEENAEYRETVKVYKYMKSVLGMEFMERFISKVKESEQEATEYKIQQNLPKQSIHERMEVKRAEIVAVKNENSRNRIKVSNKKQEEL